MKTKWTIGTRITLLSACLLLIIAAGSLGAGLTLNFIKGKAETISKSGVPGLAVSASMKSILAEGYVRTLLYGIVPDTTGKKKLLDDFTALAASNAENLKAYQALAANDREMARLFGEFMACRTPYMEARASYFELVDKGDSQTASFLERTLRPAYRAYTAAGEALFQHHKAECEAEAAGISAMSRSATATICIGSSFAIVLGFVLAYAISRSLRRKLAQITTILWGGPVRSRLPPHPDRSQGRARHLPQALRSPPRPWKKPARQLRN